ncbi:hypothetical protein [Kitasatospora aureofaciens]|uniref:hypothetical protein n=1 Tax=Kitasatospora aureofaciens TaxID=1894 RepID=UPI0037F91DC5
MTSFLVPDQLVFRKTTSPARADAEVRGWRSVSSHLAVPDCFGRTRQPDEHRIIYEDVFASGRCHTLLGDLIGAADRDPQYIPRVEALIDDIFRDILRSVEHTGRIVRLSACVPALYAERLRQGGRIDAWYRNPPITLKLPDGRGTVGVDELATYTVIINGHRATMDLPSVVADVRASLAPDSRWMTAVTQGDPTEPNIAEPLCWLDFEHAGRNTVLGEAANLLWYLLGLGGWLVPRYQPDVYARTLRRHFKPVAIPQLGHVSLRKEDRLLTVEYSWSVGPGRQAAISRTVHWLRGSLAPAAGLPTRVLLHGLRPFLTLRILGVIPARQLSSGDLLLLLAKIAELALPEMTLENFVSTVPGNRPDERSTDDCHAA